METASQPEAPVISRRSKIVTPLSPVELEELEAPARPPLRAKAGTVNTVEVEPGEITSPDEWVEPEFNEVPTGEALNDYPNEYDELLGKVFRRKDRPDSKKRYEPLTGCWHYTFPEDKTGKFTTHKFWVIEVLVFVYTGVINADKSKGRVPLRVVRLGDEGNSLVKPALFKIPADTFQRLYVLE